MDEGSCAHIWSNGDNRAKKEDAEWSNIGLKAKRINIGENEGRHEWSLKVADKKTEVL